MIWKILYFQQKAKTEMMKEKLKKQKSETQRQAGKAETYYNAYMAGLDRILDIKDSLVSVTCNNCGEETVVVMRRGGLNYCPACGFPIVQPIRQPISIAERRCYM